MTAKAEFASLLELTRATGPHHRGPSEGQCPLMDFWLFASSALSLWLLQTERRGF